MIVTMFSVNCLYSRSVINNPVAFTADSFSTIVNSDSLASYFDDGNLDYFSARSRYDERDSHCFVIIEFDSDFSKRDIEVYKENNIPKLFHSRGEAMAYHLTMLLDSHKCYAVVNLDNMP